MSLGSETLFKSFILVSHFALDPRRKHFLLADPEDLPLRIDSPSDIWKPTNVHSIPVHSSLRLSLRTNPLGPWHRAQRGRWISNRACLETGLNLSTMPAESNAPYAHHKEPSKASAARATDKKKTVPVTSGSKQDSLINSCGSASVSSGAGEAWGTEGGVRRVLTQERHVSYCTSRVTHQRLTQELL